LGGRNSLSGRLSTNHLTLLSGFNSSLGLLLSSLHNRLLHRNHVNRLLRLNWRLLHGSHVYWLLSSGNYLLTLLGFLIYLLQSLLLGSGQDRLHKTNLLSLSRLTNARLSLLSLQNHSSQTWLTYNLRLAKSLLGQSLWNALRTSYSENCLCSIWLRSLLSKRYRYYLSLVLCRRKLV
jgi:hypothetical protein